MDIYNATKKVLDDMLGPDYKMTCTGKTIKVTLGTIGYENASTIYDCIHGSIEDLGDEDVAMLLEDQDTEIGEVYVIKITGKINLYTPSVDLPLKNQNLEPKTTTTKLQSTIESSILKVTDSKITNWYYLMKLVSITVLLIGVLTVLLLAWDKVLNFIKITFESGIFNFRNNATTTIPSSKPIS
jgi:hypothetical protein